MVDLAQHALDLVLATLADDDLHGGGTGLDALRCHSLCLARVDDAADCRLAQAVVELDATAERSQVAIGQVPVHECLVGLKDMLAGVQQVLRQVAVGGKEQKARGVAVQAAHREQPGNRSRGTRSATRGALLRVAHGSEVAGRLVEHQVHGALVELAGMPSTSIWSWSTSTLVPSSVATSPFTVARGRRSLGPPSRGGSPRPRAKKRCRRMVCG